jgi:tetratricopeptide (TPR) repeat protein
MIRDKGKKVKHEDKLVTVTGRIIDFISEHAKIFIFSILAIVVIGGAVLWYYYHLQHVKLEASKVYSEFVDEYVKPPKAPADDKNAEVRDIAVMESKYDELKEKYGNTIYPTLALYFLGQAYFENGEYDKALSRFEECKNGSNKELVSIVSLWGCADCYRAMGNSEKAIEFYDTILEKYSGNALMAGVLMQKAKCYLELKDTEKAISAYRQVTIEYPQSAFVPDAKNMLTYLGG